MKYYPASMNGQQYLTGKAKGCIGGVAPLGSQGIWVRPPGCLEIRDSQIRQEARLDSAPIRKAEYPGGLGAHEPRQRGKA